MTKTKSLWKSKVFWFNTVSILLAAAQQLTHADVVPIEYVTLCVAVGNLVLRLLTDSKITLKKG